MRDHEQCDSYATIVSGSKAPTPTQNRIPSRQTNHICASNKIIYKRMNVAPDQTIILGLQIFLDHRSLSSIGQKILMTLPPHYGLTGCPIKMHKCLKKCGMMTRNLEQQFFLSVIENYIRYSALHQIFCVTVPSSGCILFQN